MPPPPQTPLVTNTKVAISNPSPFQCLQDWKGYESFSKNFKKMEIRELSVGNWVRTLDGDEMVMNIKLSGGYIMTYNGSRQIKRYVGDVSPIPLTEEILQNLNTPGLMRVYRCCIQYLDRSVAKKIKYVHQLQNLYILLKL